MEGWKSFGVFLTGFAAVVTAVTALLTYVIESGIMINDKNIKQKDELAVKEQQLAMVNDSDDWVNVRELPNTSSKVLFKLNNKQIVFIVDKTENWYRIRTDDNRFGYIYFDRLELVYNDHSIKK
jgi:uncharacterized protein YgiM (DUF1202 family)